MAPTRRNRRSVHLATFPVKVIRKGITRVRKIPLKVERQINVSFKDSQILRADANLVGNADAVARPAPATANFDEDPFVPGEADQSSNEYQGRKIKEETGWEKVRDTLRKAYVKQQFLDNNAVCVQCLESSPEPRKAVCRCLDCGWHELLCVECATENHSRRNFFHVLELWKVCSSPNFFRKNR